MIRYPPACPVFSDGIAGIRGWLVAIECEPGYLVFELIAVERGFGIVCLGAPDQLTYPVASFQFLTPHTRAARDMMAIARGGK